MKRLFATLLAMAMVLSLTACGGGGGGGNTGGGSNTGGNGAANSQPAGGGNTGGGGGGKTAITLATGSTSANYYAIGGVMAANLNGVLANSEITPVSSGASRANIQLMQEGEANMAIIQNDVSYYAYSGTDMFEGEGAYTDFSAMSALYDETIQVFSLNPDIKTFTDLKGKTVSVGAPGSGDNFAASQIFAEYGMTFDDVNAVYSSYSDSADGMKDGTVDAAFCVSGAPTTALVELAATANKPLNIITLEDEHINNLMKDYAFYTKIVIPAGTYDGLDRDVTTVSVRAMLIVSNDVSEDVVYELMNAMYIDEVDAMKASHGKLAELDPATATNGVSVPYHPGAVKFFADHGITVE